MKLEFSQKSNTNFTDKWELRDMLPNKHWIIEEIFFKVSYRKWKWKQNISKSAGYSKSILREKFVVLSVYINKISFSNSLVVYLKDSEKLDVIKPQILRIRAELNEVEILKVSIKDQQNE